MHKFLSTIIGIGIILLPLAARAQIADINSLITQTQSLIAQINALQAQTGGSTASSGGGNAALQAGVCPSISRTLSFGASGSDVSSLQQFLAQDPSVYPARLVSGYFGALTQEAVQRWQAKNGIVSSGTPASTGYGVVGPRTKAALRSMCVSAVQGSGAAVVASGFIQVAPASGNVPLTTTVTATINTNKSCAGTPYMVDFGDGTSTRQFISTTGNCNQQTQTLTHTYTSGGVYTITLAAGGHQTTATVTVNGNDAQTGGIDSIHPSAASGTVPFLVTFTGNVNTSDAGTCISNCSDLFNYGDGGSVSIPLPAAQSGYQTFTTYIVTHTYNQPGSYIASLTSGTSSALSQTFVVTPITASGTTAPVVPPTLTIAVGVNYVTQGSLLPVSWQSQNIATSSAVGLWLVNVQTGAIYPLAMTLNTTGSISAPIPATANEGTVPPVGSYEVLGKIYSPADAVLIGATPTYSALGRSDTFNILAAAATPSPFVGTYAIQSVATGVGGNQSAVNMRVTYPTCATYVVDWGDGGQPQRGGGSSTGCNTQTSVLLTHLYQYNGTVVIRLSDGNGVQQASTALAISNTGHVGSYGMLSVVSGTNSNPLNVSVQLTVPACPSFSLDWGDNTLPVSQSAAPACAGTGAQTPTFSHTYAQYGPYVIKLNDASSTLQSSSSIYLSTTTSVL